MKMMRVIVAISISVLVLGFVTFVQSAMPQKESRGSRGVEKQIRESTSSNPANGHPTNALEPGRKAVCPTI